jgi:cytidyltransferase-like protein
MPRKVLVCGCFDMLHSGHIALFREAASYGDLYVALGSDKPIDGTVRIIARRESDCPRINTAVAVAER